MNKSLDESDSMNQRSSLDALANDHQTSNPAYVEESMLSEHVSNQCMKSTELSSMHQTKHENLRVQKGRRKYIRKTYDHLPRRASKRLAAIQFNAEQELKRSNQAQEVEATQSRDRKMITNIMDQECCSFLPLENQGTVEKHMTSLENRDDVSGQLEDPLNLPIEELLRDPCIAYAAQILTGETFEAYYETSNQISSEDMNIKHSQTFAVSEGRNICHELQGYKYMLPHPENVTISEEYAAATNGIVYTYKGQNFRTFYCSVMGLSM